jgi:tetratricopeptide (TPR) repeat protein/ferredoxin
LSATIPRNSLKQPPRKECGPLGHSKRSRWRAVSLILVHVAIFIHVLHWKATGRTLTPVEPSEAMKTLELGYVNAGFILFAILILGTLVFGRFFCGWACHLVAYQDLCGWILKKLGIKPKPFRSRMLVLVPLFAAFYMFVWPQVQRIWAGGEFPALAWHLTTEGFWDTFPGFWIAMLTFAVCGFLIVVLLGNKGFCTYGCPYGAFFYHADKVAPGRILVTDDCNQCGHCTATCTSNVRVHEEVRDFKMVVDAGCMKCMDCVSVCPNGALHFGFAKPSLLKGKSARAARPKYDFTWPEELAMGAIFLFGFYAFRGLYEGIPFLLSLGISSICAFLILQGLRLAYARQVRLHWFQLKTSGRVTFAGIAFGVFTAALIGFIGHSAVWQYHWHEGNRLYSLAEHAKPENALEVANLSIRNLAWCSSNGLFEVADLEAKLGTAYAFVSNYESALPRLRRALDLNPSLTPVRYQYARSLASAGQMQEALSQLRRVVQDEPEHPGAQRDLALALSTGGMAKESLPFFVNAIKLDPADVGTRMAYGMALAQSGDLNAGIGQLEQVIRENPKMAPAYYNLALIKAENHLRGEAENDLIAALKIDPKFMRAHIVYGRLALEAKEYDAAVSRFAKALGIAPYDREAIAYWIESLKRADRLSEALRPLLKRPREDGPAWFKVVHLYRALGDKVAASMMAKRYAEDHPDLPQP